MAGGSQKTISIALILLISMLPLTVAQQTKSQTIDFSYDDNGNLLQDHQHKYIYNELNQLTQVTTLDDTIIEEYAYDFDGKRIKKIHYHQDATNTTTLYISENYILVKNQTGAYPYKYYYHNGELVASEDYNAQKTYYHPNHLGSTHIVTDETGAVIEENDYLPFGAQLQGGISRFLYTGKELDETGLYYFESRYYSPFLL